MTVTVHVGAELRFLLRPARRVTGVVELAYDPDATVGHVVQSVGVPLTEVGTLRVDDRLVGRGARLRSGARVAVEAPTRPQALAGPPAFLLDVHLGALARRLRVLGIDAAYANDATDAALVARALAEDRLLLSQDRGLLRRRELGRAAYVRGQRPDDQLADVLDRFRPPLEPFSRCTTCNGRLVPVVKSRVVSRLEPGTVRTQQNFAQCGECGRVYWRGAHAARLEQLVRRHSV